MEWVKDVWWVPLIAAGLVVAVTAIVLDSRRSALEQTPLPPLDRVPRPSTVVGVRLAPRSAVQRFSLGTSRLPGDLWLIEVEYADAAGTVRREFLADLIHDDELRRFPVGSSWQVYGFEQPRGRCLLTEAHDDVPRNGVDLDGVRVKTDRQVWPARTGSPILGVMDVATAGGDARVVGRRTSWPGDPASAWAEACAAPEAIERPRPAPRAATAEQGASCEVHWSPFSRGNGDFQDTPELILIDHRVPDEQAARIVTAFRSWLRRGDVRQELQHGPMRSYGRLSSAELFGEEAAGGYTASGDLDPGGWVLLTKPRGEQADDPWWRRAQVTPIPSEAHPAHEENRRRSAR